MTPLREVLSNIRNKRLGAISSGYYPAHTELSKVLPRLEHLEQRVEMPSSSRLDVVTEKVRECVATRSCTSLAKADWRIVPWVMWQKDTSAADQVWFLNALFDLISRDRPRSVIRALVHAYVYFFDPTKPSFTRVANFLLNTALRPGDRLADRWLAIHARFAIFNPAEGPRRVSDMLLGAEDLRQGFEEVGIAREQADGGLARAAYVWAYKAVAQHLRHLNNEAATGRAVDRLLSWATGDGDEFRYQDLYTPMATTLLEALEGSNASLELQDRMVRYFVAKFGDPRLNRARWHGISEAALEVAMRILVRATLEDFTRVIDLTADARHWRERKPFWLKYYDIGAIEDAWVAFGPKAVSRAAQLDKGYALLDNASDSAHSALILRMRDLIIVEWSHNGRCRFFPRKAGSWTPELYGRRYNFLTLHKNSDASGKYLPHAVGWQRKFVKRIYSETGIRHPKYGSG